MLPLSETFIFAGLAALALGLFTLAGYAVMRVSRGWGLFLGAGASVLMFGLLVVGGLLHYAANEEAAWLFVFSCFAPLFAVIWAYALWRASQPMLWTLGLAVAPAALIAGYHFERQIVPDDICSQSHIPLLVGEQRYDVPPAFGGHLFLTGARAQLRASQKPLHKEDLRQLCDATMRGATPARADQLWLSPSQNVSVTERFCEGAEGQPFCDGFQSGFAKDTGSLIIRKRTETSLRYELSHSNKGAEQNIAFEGNSAAGYMCELKPKTSLVNRCRMWRSLGHNVAVLSTVDLGRDPPSVTAAVQQMSDAFDFYVRAMSRQE